MRKTTIGVVIGVVAVLLAAGSALAAKPTSSLNLVVLQSGATTNGATAEPSFGGQVTFDVSTTATDRPFVNVRCYQGSNWVYDGWNGFFAAYVGDPVYTLASPYWTGGAANCTADLVYFDRQGRERTLASTAFNVAG